MRLIKDAGRVFLKSKRLILATVLVYGFAVCFLLRYYKLPLGSDSITLPLERALKLSFYLFLAVLFISYEYYLKFQKEGIAEIAICTTKGKKHRQLMAAFFILMSRKCRIWYKIAAFICCVIFFAGYAMPASKVNMNNNPDNTMAHDQYYYETGVNKVQRKDANYKITAYNMDLKIRRQLEAKVSMKVNRSLKKYLMTLCMISKFN